jgi:hypothetical protein
MRSRELLIIDVWKPLDKEVVGAAELELIRETIIQRFGTSVSPASIARALANHGVRLGHPEILEADVRWREHNLLFTPEDLAFGTLHAATALMEKAERLRQRFEHEELMLEHLRQEVRRIKSELDLLASSEKSGNKHLAEELAQWLTVWLQNPQIFPEWLALRRATPEFRARFEL